MAQLFIFFACIQPNDSEIEYSDDEEELIARQKQRRQDRSKGRGGRPDSGGHQSSSNSNTNNSSSSTGRTFNGKPFAPKNHLTPNRYDSGRGDRHNSHYNPVQWTGSPPVGSVASLVTGVGFGVGSGVNSGGFQPPLPPGPPPSASNIQQYPFQQSFLQPQSQQPHSMYATQGD